MTEPQIFENLCNMDIAIIEPKSKVKGRGEEGEGNWYNMMENCFLVIIIDSAIYFM